MRPLLLSFGMLLLSACGGTTPSSPDGAIVGDASAADAAGAGADASLAPDGGSARPDAGGADAGADPCTRPGVQIITKLEATPATLEVARGTEVELTVVATYGSGCVRELTSVYFLVGDPTIAQVTTTTDAIKVRGLSNGTTTLGASSEPDGKGVLSNSVTVTVGDPATSTTETRALWITRYAFASDATKGPADVRALLDKARAANFNVVFFQVRGMGDAYYKSALVPSWGGGKGLGKDPGWDPLQVAVDYGHQKGLQVHAYLNVMTGWVSTLGAVPATTPPHVLAAHPEYRCRNSAGAEYTSADDKYVYLGADPGYRTHFADVVEELITTYAVDGVHLDRVRAPGPDYCHTPALDAAFATSGQTWAAFARTQLDEGVKAVSQRMLAKKPAMVLSASVWGIYTKLPGCTGAYSEGLNDFHQDSLAWVQKGWVDLLAPMIYWPIKPGACTDFAALTDFFAAGMNGRLLVSGMSAVRKSFPELAADIDHARQRKIAGTAVFDTTYLDDGALWDDFTAATGPYPTPVAPTPLTHR